MLLVDISSKRDIDCCQFKLRKRGTLYWEQMRRSNVDPTTHDRGTLGPTVWAQGRLHLDPAGWFRLLGRSLIADL